MVAGRAANGRPPGYRGPMVDVEVRCEPQGAGWTCRVRISGDGPATEHEVTVSAADLARLAPDAIDPDDLVRRSFAFLLAREPNTSILRRFDLSVIGTYFPEYEREIRH
jgi:hypothetical protein